MNTLTRAKELAVQMLTLGMVFKEVAYDRSDYSRGDEVGRISVGLASVQITVNTWVAARAVYLAEQFDVEYTGDASIGYTVTAIIK